MNIIGFDNTKQTRHPLTNTLDGNLELFVYVNKAKGRTIVYVNDAAFCVSDAENGCEPFLCGKISLPRGEFWLAVKSECEINEIVLSEYSNIDTTVSFLRAYEERPDGEQKIVQDLQVSEETIEIHKRHGFIFEESYDCALGKMPSGVPLGGMGCGKLEIAEDGMFTAFTGNNNQDSPIYRMPGSFMAVGSGDTLRIMRKDPLDMPYTSMKSVESNFVFPFAELKAEDPALDIHTEIKAFSPHIPGNAADSALPVVFFDVTLQNTADKETDALFCFSWENIINVGGSMAVRNRSERIFPTCSHTWNYSFIWSDRRVNTCERRKTADGLGALVFSAEDDRKNPMSFGEHLLWCSDENAEYLPDRSILPEDEKEFAAWLKNPVSEISAHGDSEFRAGAVVIRRRLDKGESHHVRFVLAWYMPNMLDDLGQNPGVEYTNRFDNVEEVLQYALKHRDRLYAQTKELQNILEQSTLPDWFVRRILDDRFVTNTCSWYDKDGNFSINEAPTGMFLCLGTLDQRTASQGYYTAFYPELDKVELDLFRRSHGANGMCAHEIGFGGIKLLCRATTQWPDLVSAYIIQVYHTYQRTGDRDFLKLHWPAIKKAVEWTISLDEKDCGIPFICRGRGTTYDNQFWEGINAFISTMQIASYRIGSMCAAAVGEQDTADAWTALAAKAEDTRAKHLWNKDGQYYCNAYNPDTGETDTSCFISALAGEWAMLRAGIKPGISLEQIALASAAITEQCVGPNGLTDQGGRKDTTQGFIQYPLSYLAAPAFYAGNTASGWKVTETTEKVITGPCSTHFTQGLTYSYTGERHGLPYYMTAPASWTVLESLVGLRADLAEGVLTLAPLTEDNKKFSVPVFLPYAWFSCTVSEDGSTMQLTPIRSLNTCSFNRLKIKGHWSMDGAVCTYADGYTVAEMAFDPGTDTVCLTKCGDVL
ncbi:MAG: hypothetical protein IJ325_09775 [Clostridia bacterium]|nr:hypothetical protein [Clostridia bacterium]